MKYVNTISNNGYFRKLLALNAKEFFGHIKQIIPSPTGTDHGGKFQGTCNGRTPSQDIPL